MLTVSIALKEHGPSIKKISEKAKVFSKVEVETVSELWDEYLNKGVASGYYFLISKENEDITGFTCYGPHSLTAGAYDIYWIAVDPDFQNRGIGRALLNRVEEEVEKLHGNLLILETSSTPPYLPAREFYTRIGFTLEATIHDFYAPEDHLVIFTKHVGRRTMQHENHLLQEA
jgi:ribosomal protein S18 acetylase RimI-like enzyme